MNPDMKRLCDAAKSTWNGPDPDWWMNDVDAERLVRAVLTELSDPSRDMLNRGGYHCITDAGAVTESNMGQAKAVWKAMVKTILQD